MRAILVLLWVGYLCKQLIYLLTFLLEPHYTEQGEVDAFVCLALNDAAAHLTRRPANALMGQKLADALAIPEALELFDYFCHALGSFDPAPLEWFVSAASSVWNEDRWYKLSPRALEGKLVVTFEDITQRKLTEQHITELAYRDALTGLHNRRYLEQRLPELLALARRQAWSVALIYFDLNGFKAINDTYGHGVGDKVLVEVAQRLDRVIRVESIFVRLGGDEFVLFLPDAGVGAAHEVAERLAAALSSPFTAEQKSYPVGASLGVATMSAEDASLEALLGRADQAMYRAKKRKQLEVTPIEHHTVLTPTS